VIGEQLVDCITITQVNLTRAKADQVTITGSHQPSPYSRPDQSTVPRYVDEFIRMDRIFLYHVRPSRLAANMS
jgi:hypothetical protein